MTFGADPHRGLMVPSLHRLFSQILANLKIFFSLFLHLYVDIYLKDLINYMIFCKTWIFVGVTFSLHADLCLIEDSEIQVYTGIFPQNLANPRYPESLSSKIHVSRIQDCKPIFPQSMANLKTKVSLFWHFFVGIDLSKSIIHINFDEIWVFVGCISPLCRLLFDRGLRTPSLYGYMSMKSGQSENSSLSVLTPIYGHRPEY